MSKGIIVVTPVEVLTPVCVDLDGTLIFWAKGRWRTSHAGRSGWLALVALLGFNWSGRDPQAVDTFVRGHLQSSDVVLADFRPYYAAMNRTKAFYAPTYLGVMQADEKQSLTALLLREEQFEAAQGQLDGHWSDTGFTLAPPSNRLARVLKMKEFDDDQYALHLYRKDPAR